MECVTEKKYISKDMRVKPHVRTVPHVTGIRAAGVWSYVDNRQLLWFYPVHCNVPEWCNQSLLVWSDALEYLTVLDVSSDSGTPELKYLVTKLFSMNTKFSSLVMRSNMDYWQSFRIKVSHHDTYTRNHCIWRHLLCIYLFTNLMCTITILITLRVSLYSYRQCTYFNRYTVNTHKLIFICCCNLL